ncbi:WGR and DUF4132 domain-containing protein [Kitasatospora sp. CB01950]|uniref:WGR and DUF4132 domain-containing protein n=1 Tax=Kitasatospora sp. CB01950 TaxID=1703930 RepID=UPI000B26F42D|nr:DUF4132 domain-containing protein [Kitasatospora sp. CB01950]
MRRWELVGDGSAKFWEAVADGASVQVRYGRIGTAGRVQVKDLADPAAAEAHLAKLIAEKERKGYREASAADAPPAGPALEASVAPSVETAVETAVEPAVEPLTGNPEETDDAETDDAEFAELPDEDAFVLPTSWYPLVVPRRGGGVPVGPPRPVVDAAAAAERESLRIAKNETRIEEVLAGSHSEARLVRAARAHLAGMPDAIGAATVAAMLRETWQKGGFQEVLDSWIARFGLGFAARATVTAFEFDEGAARPSPYRAALVTDGPNYRDPRAAEFAFGLAQGVRRALASAEEDEYRSVLAELASIRTTWARQVVTAFLAPEVPGWVDECLADPRKYRQDSDLHRSLLLHSVGTAAQVDLLRQHRVRAWTEWTPVQLATLADGVGMACVPLFGHALGAQYDNDRVRELALLIAEFPGDEAFRVLLDRISVRHVRPALLRAMRRFPVRAVRLLAEFARQRVGAEAAGARQLLVSQLGVLRAQLPEVLARLDADTAEFVGSLVDPRQQLPEAAASALPELLAAPPWTRPRPARKAKVLTGVTVEDEPELVWLPGELESWSVGRQSPWAFGPDYDWAAEMEIRLRGSGGLWYGAVLLAQGPAELARPYLAEWRPGEYWNAAESLRPVVARFGLDALPLLHAGAAAQPGHVVPLLLPFRDATVAGVMADALMRLKSQRASARSWFARHGVAGALLLVPNAVGKAGRARQAAENALRLVAAQQGADVLLDTVRDRFGEAVAAVVASALNADPLVNALPARMPEFPDWLPLGALPQLVLRSGEALPRSAVRQVVTMMALSKLRDPYPGLPLVAELLRPESAAEFGWALFEEWRQAGMPAADSWALFVLGEWGDDGTARRLAPVLREWPGAGAHHRAVEGLEVLAAIGSDVALMQLQGIAQRVKFKALKVRAQEKVAEIAEALGLTGEQLADRLVPELGLDTDGTTVVDYGARTFTVGFDEQLRPFVLDADGKRRKDLPVPGAADDPELAAAERKRFSALKKEVRALASDQIHRLEAAMVAERTWTAAEFGTLLVGHPLLRHLVRRFVWSTAETAFRVVGDRGFADVHDNAFALPDDAVVRLVHPLRLGDDLAAWAELFAGHGLLQPFRQLGRPTAALTAEEAAGHRLHRFEGAKVPVGRLLGLTKRGWQRGTPEDAGVERWFHKPLPNGRHLVIALEPGIWVGVVTEFPEQTFGTVWLDTRAHDYWPGRGHHERFADLGAVTASELLADLEELTAD